ncbi:hemerythrin domain-containing protein [Kineothrix sp. MB12-C1]|uniref:hemerythrin domain-containing protein n=1 Tax=Kineothrix sp. MB12-C1 TaxID=3070215 RepID=UPI0027D28712|nr:hemerythrin domain-containing protein [Kineothrix sp. MB12-C1]WMC93045.1 hemerythrin domain-containing protein [Kineothrix sp. MB12-C1]
MNLKSYLEQHENIAEEIQFLQSKASSDISEEEAGEIAKHINTLAGKLNIHLTMEDKYLYPSLLAKGNTGFAIESYIDEMGGLAKEFTEFKEKYNTKPKLLEAKASFARDANTILNKITARVKKEEDTIYKLID